MKIKPLFKLIIILAIIVVVVVLFVSGIVSFGGVRSLNGTTTFTVNGSTPIVINGHEYIMSTEKAGSNRAYLYMAESPIFLSPVFNITITTGNSTKVNLDSKQANVGITLLSVSSNSAVITMAPLPQYLELTPDSANIRVMNITSAGTYGGGAQQYTSTSNTTSIATTTVVGSHTTTVVSSVTTTVGQSHALNGNIYTALNGSTLYPLMLNYSKLYANTTNCTLLKYDNLYLAQHNAAPAGATSYQNASYYGPYAMVMSIINNTGGTNTAVFRVKTRYQGLNNTIAVSIVVNPSQISVVSENISKTGIFSGLSVSDIANAYARAVSIGGACGVWVP